MTTGILYDELFLRHETGPAHPERASRLSAAWRRIENSGLADVLVRVPAGRRASLEEMAAIHEEAYLDAVLERIRDAAGPLLLDAGDTVASAASLEPVLRAAGAGLELADRVMAGEFQNAFALVRPPGHHAERDRAMGFCIVNNIAVLARYLQRRHGLRRIAIVDFDVHHGNGTQHAFYADPDVLYVSLHQYPHYPGTGAASERGYGAGEGTTLNLPLPAGAGPLEYLRAFEDPLLPALREFRPEALLLSAGFDAHRADPLSGTRLESETYRSMTSALCETMRELGCDRVLSLLEGGYELEALADSVEAHLQALIEAPGVKA